MTISNASVRTRRSASWRRFCLGCCGCACDKPRMPSRRSICRQAALMGTDPIFLVKRKRGLSPFFAAALSHHRWTLAARLAAPVALGDARHPGSILPYQPCAENCIDSVSRRNVTSCCETARYQVCRSACGLGLAKPAGVSNARHHEGWGSRTDRYKMPPTLASRAFCLTNQIDRPAIEPLVLAVEPLACGLLIADDGVQRSVHAHEEQGELPFLAPVIELVVAVVEASYRGRADAQDLGEQGARDAQPLSSTGHGFTKPVPARHW